MEKLNLPPYGQSVSSFDPAEYDRRKVESYNSTQGNLTGYDCQKCKNKGSYATVKEGGGLSFVECSCMKIRRCVQKMEASGLREVIRDYTFEAYQDTESWQTTIKQGGCGLCPTAGGMASALRAERQWKNPPLYRCVPPPPFGWPRSLLHAMAAGHSESERNCQRAGTSG